MFLLRHKESLNIAMISSTIILGGGTAGLISALLMKKTNPNVDVRVIESSSIGIIGVGEGSTEHWSTLMQLLDIDVKELLLETGATFKSGIKFTNWHGDNTNYWHSLIPEFVALDHTSGINAGLIYAIAHNQDPEMTVPDEVKDSIHPLDFKVNQFHFDTNKLNLYFHKLGKKLGIEFVEDIIKDVKLDSSGNVECLCGEKDSYYAELFIDSSGFNRLINSKLDSKWIDCQKYLPMNSAIAFPTPYQEKIPSHTEARALSSGWMWRIPTQDRFGNGYVYCDHFITDEEALAEAQTQFDHKIEIGKKIKFSAGYLDKFWQKNCVSVGLAGMFVEPLEATSIGFTIQQTLCLLAALPYWTKQEDIQQETYNNIMDDVATNIIDFVQLHYFTQRRDSKFWQWAADNLEWTEWNKQNIDRYKTALPGTIEFNEHFLMFKGANFQQVMHGLRLFDAEKIKLVWDKHYANLSQDVEYIQSVKISNTIPHRELLKIIMGEQYDLTKD